MSLTALLHHPRRPSDAAPKISAAEIVRCYKLATDEITPSFPDVNSPDPATRGAALIIRAWRIAIGEIED